jgi:hypothetical protein
MDVVVVYARQRQAGWLGEEYGEFVQEAFKEFLRLKLSTRSRRAAGLALPGDLPSRKEARHRELREVPKYRAQRAKPHRAKDDIVAAEGEGEARQLERLPAHHDVQILAEPRARKAIAIVHDDAETRAHRY